MPLLEQNDCASNFARGEQGGCESPCPTKAESGHGRDYALDVRLTLPVTLTDAQPAEPRDRAGAIPKQRIQSASAHSGGGGATFRAQSLRCQDR